MHPHYRRHGRKRMAAAPATCWRGRQQSTCGRRNARAPPTSTLAPRHSLAAPSAIHVGLCRVLAVVWAADSLSTLRCLPAGGISLIRRMLSTGELARREASRSDPERLVAFSRHNRLACDQSSRFWALPAAYRRDLLAPAAGEHAVLNPDRLIDVHSCCQSRTGSPGPRCATRQIVTFPLSTATHLPALATHLC